MTLPRDYEPVVARTPEALEAEAADREAAAELLAKAERERMIRDERQAERERAERFRRSHQ
jgi:hypothetical protein